MHQEAFFASPIAGLYTIADLARLTGASIESTIATIERLRLAPRKRNGVVRLWDDAALAEIKLSLRAT